MGQSDPSDYEVTDETGDTINGFVLVPAGGSTDVVIDPVADSFAEYPEVVTLTIDSHPDYIPGFNSSASCTISDATDTVDNETTFKAIYTPEGVPAGTAQTSATGYATLTINGPKTEAVFFSTYSGLTVAQSTAHIHHVAQSQPGVPDFTSAGPVIEQLNMTGPHDNVTNPEHVWTITDTAGFSVSDIINALFQQNGLSIYCNVHTGTYPGGEIWGFFEEFEGAVAITNEESTAYESPAPLEPLPANEDLKRDISRFLSQATWGPRMSDIDALYNEITSNPAYDLGNGSYDQVAAYSSVDHRPARPRPDASRRPHLAPRRIRVVRTPSARADRQPGNGPPAQSRPGRRAPGHEFRRLHVDALLLLARPAPAADRARLQ